MEVTLRQILSLMRMPIPPPRRGTPDRTQTCDPLLRRQLLCSAELRGHINSGKPLAKFMVLQVGLEPTANRLKADCSSSELLKYGWDGRTRTCAHSINSRPIYQLNYIPMVRVTGLEPAQCPDPKSGGIPISLHPHVYNYIVSPDIRAG